MSVGWHGSEYALSMAKICQDEISSIKKVIMKNREGRSLSPILKKDNSFKGALPGLSQFMTTISHLKIMKNLIWP